MTKEEIKQLAKELHKLQKKEEETMRSCFLDSMTSERGYVEGPGGQVANLPICI